MGERYTLEQLRTGMDHPRFPNPTLAEVWAEIHFQPHPGQEWNDEWYGTFFQQVAGILPRMSPFGTRGATGLLEGDPWETLPPQGMTFTSRDGVIQAQLAPGQLLFRHLERYPSWEKFRELLQSLWQPLAAVVNPLGVWQSGLRYIDLVPWSPGEPVDDWVQRLPQLPPDLFDRKDRFSAEYRWVEGPVRTKLLVAHAWKPDETPVLVLDLELRRRASQKVDWANLAEDFNDLHDRCWQLFVSMLTERYLEHLQEGGAL